MTLNYEQQKNLNTIIAELSKEIRVSVVWDGYYNTDKPEEHFIADTDCNQHFSAKDILEYAEKSIGMYDDDNIAFTELEKQCKQLKNIIEKWAKGIHERGYNYTNAEDLSKRYYELSARRFEQKHMKECVLIAPPHWMPC